MRWVLVIAVVVVGLAIIGHANCRAMEDISDSPQTREAAARREAEVRRITREIYVGRGIVGLGLAAAVVCGILGVRARGLQ